MFLDYSLNSCAYRIYNLRTKTITESINVVIDNFTGIFREDEVVYLTNEAECQMQKTNVTPNFVTQTGRNSIIEPAVTTISTIESIIEIFDIIDSTLEIHQPKSRRVTQLKIS